MLTYQDVVTIKLDPLTTAAGKWDEMAKAFKAVEDLYKGQVQPVAEDGSWQGFAVGSASAQFKATRAQLQGAQTEAKAMASLLRDAHGQFVTLCKVVTDMVAKAVEDDMSVNDKGEASYDFSKTAKYHNDPDYSDFVRKRKAAEQTWTKRIKDAVQAVDDADQGAQLAFRKAAGVKTGLEKLMPGMAQHGFNTQALGDIELYEAREAKEYADRLLDGDKLSAAERAEWDRLYRDNADTKEFSRTLLDSLGPEKTIQLGNKLNDLAYFDDTGNKKDYLGLEKGLANTIAGATRVPEFKDEHGKPIAYGSKAYREKFDAWTKSDDASFYNDWRKGLQKAGVEQYDLEAAGEKIAIGRGHDQQIRGYQGLVTLMQQGDHYSPQFLADVTDDMIAAEKKDKNIWDLYGEFEGKDDGWFANDPVDGSLQIMSKDPVASTGYLDPGAGGDDAEHRTNDRLKYLMDRDTDLVNNTGWRGNIDYVAADTEDADAKSGLGAVIEAASTGSCGRFGHRTRRPSHPRTDPGHAGHHRASRPARQRRERARQHAVAAGPGPGRLRPGHAQHLRPGGGLRLGVGRGHPLRQGRGPSQRRPGRADPDAPRGGGGPQGLRHAVRGGAVPGSGGAGQRAGQPRPRHRELGRARAPDGDRPRRAQRHRRRHHPRRPGQPEGVGR